MTYYNTRNVTGNPVIGAAGDLGPESIQFIPGINSPTGKPLLLVGNEISGTTSVYSVKVNRLDVRRAGPSYQRAVCTPSSD